MRLLNNPDLLLKLHDELEVLTGEIDDDENVPDRYESNLAAIVADNDSKILNAASGIIHRLYLNCKYPKLDALAANYVKFDQEVTSG